MKPRTRTLGVLGTALVSTGLVVGLAVAATSSAATGRVEGTSTTVVMPTDSMPMNSMPMRGSMMPEGMAGMMEMGDMSSMHSMMHDTMRSQVADDVLAACDRTHASMVGDAPTPSAIDSSQHGAHHGDSGS